MRASEAALAGVRRRIESAVVDAGRDPADVRLLAVTKYVDAPEVRRLIDLGVRAWVFQHFPDDVIAVNRDGDCVRHGSVQMPASAIVGTGGAGDALAAGILTGLHEGWDIAACLELGVCCAATSLREANCSCGVTPWQDALRFGRERGYHTLSA